MSAADDVAQIRLRGHVAAGIYLSLEALTENHSLPRLYVDLRNWEGERLLNIPARLVDLRRIDGEDAPTAGVEIAAVFIVDKPGKKQPAVTAPNQIVKPQAAQAGKRRRRSRAYLEQRDKNIRLWHERGWSTEIIANTYALSQKRIKEIVRVGRKGGSSAD